MLEDRVIVAGGACSCVRGRTVRFAIPPGVHGCPSVISCRVTDSSDRASIREHAFPAGYEYQIRCANINAR